MPRYQPLFRRCLILLSFIVVCFSSCNEDKVEKGKDFTVTIDDTSDGLAIYYYFLSDEQGNVIDFSELTEAGNIELKPSAPYKSATYSLTKVTLSDSPVAGGLDFSAITYAGIDVQSLTWKPFGVDPNYKDIFFKFSGQPGSKETCTVSCNATTSFPGDAGAESVRMSTYGDASTKLLATVRNNISGDVKYRLFDHNGSGFMPGNFGNPYAVDLSLVTETLPTKTISAPPDGVSQVLMTVRGIRDNGAIPEIYYITHYNYLIPGPLTIPDAGSVFDGYLYGTAFSKNNYQHTVFSSSVDFEGLQFGISVAASQPGALTFTTTGTYDYGMLTFDSPNGESFWEVYVPSSTDARTVKLPELPAELLGKITGAPLTNLNFTRFTAMDLKDREGFQDFIQRYGNISHPLQERKIVIVYAEDIGG